MRTRKVALYAFLLIGHNLLENAAHLWRNGEGGGRHLRGEKQHRNVTVLNGAGATVHALWLRQSPKSDRAAESSAKLS